MSIGLYVEVAGGSGVFMFNICSFASSSFLAFVKDFLGAFVVVEVLVITVVTRGVATVVVFIVVVGAFVVGIV